MATCEICCIVEEVNGGNMVERGENGKFIPTEGSLRRSVAFRLTDKDYERFQQAAKARGLSLADLARAIVLMSLDVSK